VTLPQAASLGLSRTLARHVVRTTFTDLPPGVANATKTSILDAIGVTIAASSLGEGCGAFIETARESGAGPSRVLGCGFSTTAPMAAFANGAMAHALDFEDTHDETLVHPHAAAVPAALALAESIGGVSGREFITAVALGADLACRLGLGFIEGPEGHGYIHLPMLGAYGAAAACGKLLQLDDDAMVHALALASCQAIMSEEIRATPDSQLRAVRDAFTAKAGLVSALLAKRGVKAFDRPFEGPAGLYGLHGRRKINADRILEDLGWTYENARVSYKPWPSCRGTHAFVEAASSLLRNHKLDPTSIDEIAVTVSPFFAVLCDPPVQKQQPATAIDAKFSIPFTVAVALRNGTVSLADFEPAALADTETLAIARRVAHVVQPAWGKAESTRGAVSLRLRSGAELSAEVVAPLGHPANPIAGGAIVQKFLDCLRHARAPMSSAACAALGRNLAHLEAVDDMRALFGPAS
jgi:2-methylcitrate dehydratase PrpD